MNAYFAQELDVIEPQQPVRIIGNNGLAVGQVDEAANLFLEAFHIVMDEFRREHLAHLIFAARITNHARTAAHEDNGTMTGTLHMGHDHKSDEMTYMKLSAVGSKPI